MDFELTESETELAEGVRQLCRAGSRSTEIRRFEGANQVVDREGWLELGAAGVFNLCLAEDAGGVGLGLTEAALVFEELGRALVPGPWLLRTSPPVWSRGPMMAQWWSGWWTVGWIARGGGARGGHPDWSSSCWRTSTSCW